ncbi:MAG: hypothetical protein ACF8PN_02790 [Phycisphaerales bacterium]
MSDIQPMGSVAIHRVQEYSSNGSVRVDRDGVVPRENDRIDLSEEARHAADLVADNPIREGLVARVRAEIMNGEYESPEKLDAALDQLLLDLE